MSKLYKELKYDTDRVMQPGDPLTSPDGQTKVKVNDDGTALISYGNSYEVTLTIPEVSGASFRVRFTKGTTSGGMADYSALITSISGLENAVADQYGGRGISVNGEYWGEVAVMATDAIFQESGDPLPDSSKRMPIFGGFYANFYLRSPEGLSSWCDWSNLSQPVETVEKEISIEGHTHSASDINSGVLPIVYGGTGVNGNSQAANKVLASPSGGSGTIAFRSLVAADIPDLSTSKLTTGTLGVARGGTGKISHTVNSVIIGGISTTGALQNVTSAKGAFYSTGSNKKPTFGTLPVAQGGTGMTTTTNVNAVVIGNSSDAANAMQTVAAASGAFYSTGANVKPKFGTLPVAQGGTGVNGSSQAINKVLASPASGSAGAISFRSLVEADIPTLSTSKISGLGDAATKNVGTASGTVAAGDHTHSASDLTSGTLSIARGGTGATTASAALTALGAASTSDATINLQFSDWSFDTTPLEGHYTVTFYEDMDGDGTPGWQFLWYDQYGSVLSSGDVYTSDRNATYLDFSTYTPSRPGVIEHVIATRSLIGYRLGPVDGLNPDKHLAMANHTHSSLTDGTYTVSIPVLSSNGILALDGHTHPTVSTTYSNLVALRTNSQLIPGVTYRITDYVTTTSATDTQSAGHAFDLLVVADDVNKLNENARAIMHETISEFDPTKQYSVGDYVKQQNTTKKFTKTYTGTFDSNTTYHNQDVVYYSSSYYQVTADQTSGVSWANLPKTATSISNFLTADSPYFGNSKLEAWKIKYCLDNDATRFAWADTSNGKGVIYEMEDEWGNKCGYDFKNIQFKRYKITGIASTMLTGYTLTDLQSALVYSSSSKGYMALSTSMSIYGCDSVNVDSASYQWCYTFSTSITDPSDASLNGSSRLNRIGSYINETGTKYTLNNIVMRGKNLANEIDVNCYNMTFKGALTRCHISDHCSNFTMGGGGYSYIGSACDNIVLSGNALTAGRDLHIGSSCSNIVSGLRLQKTTIGSGCKYISFGRYVMYCNIGAACQYIHFGSSTESKSYYEAVTIEPENQYIYLDCTGSTSTSAYYKNVTIGKGVNNTTTWKTITDANTNQSYETTYQAENSLVIPV